MYFQDYSYHNPISWSWDFSGANPAVSNLENLYTTYPSPGVFDVSLTSSGDSINFLTEPKSDAVIVMDYNGEQLPFYEGFETINFNSPEWISNIGNWSVTDEVSYNGSYCLKVQNSGVAEGTKHVLESKTFDLSDSTKAYFNFKYAFARKNSTNNDYLKVLASNDCGKTWSVRKILQYSQLVTAPDQNNFLPSFGDWREATITSLIGPFCVQNFRFKFEFESGGGNDLYIDNINISYENTTEINTSNMNEVSIFPNPANNNLTVSSSKIISELAVFDIMGKQVLSNKKVNSNTVNINTSKISKGYYSISLKQGEEILIKSFMKN